jgi:heat shock protein HslJ
MMKRWLLPLLIVALSACVQSQDALANTSWILKSYGPENAQQTILPDTSVTLEIDKTVEQAGGVGGCNTYGGNLTVQKTTFGLKEITLTEMACVDSDIMEQEARYFDLLQRVTTFEQTDATLVLIAGEERLEFVAK